ncbi:MAG TPA: hypothetical protein VNZ86_15595, partial [Bacteroidia bacterium]|nr:hypothetical protein [Bacteroidia bacterium]
MTSTKQRLFRPLFYALFLFLALDSHAQQFQKIKYKGDSVFVYPFPYYCWDYYENPFFEPLHSRRYGNENSGLFLTSIPLPEGKWIAYFNDPAQHSETTGTPSKSRQQVALEFSASQGKLNGFARAYNRAGKRIAEGNYRDGEKSGSWTMYDFRGKEQTQRMEYTAGLPDGACEYLHKGKRYALLHYKNAELDGVQSTWYPNGQINQTASYMQGVRNGPFERFYADGKRAEQGSALWGNLTGWYREWTSKGIQLEETHYLEEEVIKQFRDSSVQKLKTVFYTWVGGYDGPSVKRWSNGQLKNKSFYSHGVKVYGDTVFNEKGGLSFINKDSMVYRKDTILVSVVKEFYPSGLLHSYTYSWPDSVETTWEYDADGKLESHSISRGYRHKDKYRDVIAETGVNFNTGLDSDSTLITSMVMVSNRNLNKGMERNRQTYDPVSKNFVEITHNQKGQRIATDSIINGRKRIKREFDANGKPKKITYCSPNPELILLPGSDFYTSNWVQENYQENDFEGLFVPDSEICFLNGLPRNGKAKIDLGYHTYAKGILTEGRQTGLWKVYSHGRSDNYYWMHRTHLFDPRFVSKEVNFVNNQAEGTTRIYKMCHSMYKLYGHSRPFRYLAITITVHNHKTEGDLTEFDPSGAVLSRTSYHRDVKDGREANYWENGKCKDSLNYKSGVLEGCNGHWTLEGIRTDETCYKQGINDGIWKEWYENGIKKTEGTYLNGNRIGTWLHYFSNGQPNARIEFLSPEETKKHTPPPSLLPASYKERLPTGPLHVVDRRIRKRYTEAEMVEEGNASVTYYY